MKRSTAWCLYDVGNSAFATTIMAAVLPIYFTSVASQGLDPDPERARVLASSNWGYANTLAMALTALSAPVLGALADASGGRKPLLAGFATLGALATLCLAFTGTGDWVFVAALYVLGRIGFASSIVMYDGLLPHVAAPDQLDRVSAKGFAWGYLGGGLLLALQMLVITKPTTFGFADATAATRAVFVSVGLWWLLLTLPLLRHVPEPPPEQGVGLARGWSAFGAAFGRLRETFHELRRYREAFKFLVAFWFYNDGIGTIVVMAVAFGAEIGLERGTLIGAILLVQFLGFPFSLAFGRLAGRIGARNAILVGIAGYTVLCGLAYFVHTARDFWMMAIGVSMFQGGCQALSRSLFASMIPPERSAEFFGFYDVSSKFAGIVGPLLLATVARSMGSTRYGVIALVLLFVAGAAVLLRVSPERARKDLAASEL